jgi:hypothetical protein
MVLDSSWASNVEPGTNIVVVFDVLDMFNVELPVVFWVLDVDVDVDDVRARLRARKVFQGVSRGPRGFTGIRRHHGSMSRR